MCCRTPRGATAAATPSVKTRPPVAAIAVTGSERANRGLLDVRCNRYRLRSPTCWLAAREMSVPADTVRLKMLFFDESPPMRRPQWVTCAPQKTMVIIPQNPAKNMPFRLSSVNRISGANPSIHSSTRQAARRSAQCLDGLRADTNCAILVRIGFPNG